MFALNRIAVDIVIAIKPLGRRLLPTFRQPNNCHMYMSDAARIRQAIAAIEGHLEIEHVLEVPPVRLTTVDGFDTAVFPYTTDIPFLARWGEPLLFGPGSIHVAHTADEFVSISELHAAVDHYMTIAQQLLDR